MKKEVIKGLVCLLVVGVMASMGWASKPSVPMDVNLQLKREHLLLGDVVDVEIKIVPRRDIEKATVTFSIFQYPKKPEKGSPTLTLIGKDYFELGELKKNTAYYLTTQVKISNIGAGELRGGVDVVASEDKWSFGKSDTLYFIVSKKEVLVGKWDFSFVIRENLDRKLKNRLINEKGYKKELEEFEELIRSDEGKTEIYILRPDGSREYLLYPDGRVGKGYKRVIKNGKEYLIRTKEK